MPLLLTGATGFIGSRLLPGLLEDGHKVRALLRPGATLPLTGVEAVRGELPDQALCRSLCAGIDCVLHLAGLAHVNASPAALRHFNVDATLQLARAAREQGVARFLFLSSSKAAWPAHSVYARCKAEAERELLALQQPGFTVHCLRPALVYGPGMRGNLAPLLRILVRPRLPVFIKSDNPLGMIGVDDLCRALRVLLVQSALPGRIWALDDGQSYTLDQIVYHVRAALALPLPQRYAPRPLVWLVARMAAALAPLVGSSFSMSTYRTLYVESHRSDPAFGMHSGFQPRDSFYSLLPELLAELPR